MSAYIIFNYKILDATRIDEFTALTKPINEKYQAEVIVACPAVAVEGSIMDKIVIYKFKDFDSATKWYHCSERQQLMTLRDSVLQGWGTIVPDTSETESVSLSGYFKVG